MSRRDRLRLVFFSVFAFAFTATLTYLFAAHPGTSTATTLGFSAGNIINDYTMGNYTTMSEGQIQTFLKSKNHCNDRDLSKYYAYTAQGYQYHIENGHFVCMADENFNGESAAHIIWQASQDYKINPQVLIVLLQKEQGLVTDTWPNTNYQLRSATGFACPDTAACDSKYYGFKNQVRNAARVFREVLDGGWTNYPVGPNFIKFHPDYPDGSWVYIENRATSALYRYTPYQPTGAALAAGYAKTNDHLASYGNRNFYNYFTDWFGSTQNSPNIARRQVITEGTYTFTSALGSNVALAASATNNVEIAARAATDSQKWQVAYDPEDYSYTFTNVATGLTLDLQGASTDKGANIHLYANNGTCAQKWYAVPRNNGTYTFLSSCSALMALDVYGALSTPGTNVQTYLDNGTNAQRWAIVPERSIADGLYEITTDLDSGLALDIAGGAESAGRGTNLQIYSHNETLAQRWKLTFDATSGTYTIINPKTGLAIDVSGGGTGNGTNVHIYTPNGTCAQKWYILPSQTVADGYEVLSACAGAALDVYGAAKASRTNVQIYQQNQTSAQTWHFNSISPRGIIADGVYTIVPGTNSAAALDIAGGAEAASNGTNVQIYEQNQTAAQEWRLTFDPGDDTYTIANATNPRLVLDLAGASLASGTNIHVYAPNGTCAQKWLISSDDDDTFAITSTCSGKVLDVVSAGTANRTNVWVYTSNHSAAQKWSFIQK